MNAGPRFWQGGRGGPKTEADGHAHGADVQKKKWNAMHDYGRTSQDRV